MTQTEFGELVGVPQSTVARLESGQQNPSVGMLRRIAKATDTELVIEFRHRKRARKTASGRRVSATASAVARRAERVAASARWQAMEREADEDVADGSVSRFESVDELIAHLAEIAGD